MGLPIEGGFADVEETSFDLLPASTYDAVVFDSEVKEAGEDAKYPGNDYIAWEFKITEDGYEGRKQWYNTSLATTPKAIENREKVLGMLLSFLKVCGVSEKQLKSKKFELDPEDLYGTPVKLVVTKREWPKGSKDYFNRVKKVLPANATDNEDDDELPG